MKPRYLMSPDELAAVGSAGDHEATLMLARFAQHGLRGVPQDPERAALLVRRAADARYPHAMRLLGDRYMRGNGVPEDNALSTRWWRDAAAAGDVDAMANLLDLRTSSSPTEAAEGRHWLRLAASQGHPHALHIQAGGKALEVEDLAAMSLDDMAAAAPIASTNELSWDREGIAATLAQFNDVIGRWLERLRAAWPMVSVATTIHGAEIDFPCPDVGQLPRSIEADNDSLEVHVREGLLHLKIYATKWEEGWSLTLSSFEPHPPISTQRWLVGELIAAGAEHGVTI
ncbi:MAG TPA: hypothetical protein VGM90_07770 [Kofleriaceae bacterium]